MASRYYADRPIQYRPEAASRVTLTGSEAHHLIHVMRASKGRTVVLFDGSGAEFPSRVDRVGRSDVELTVLTRREADRELPRRVSLAVSLPKGDRQRWLVEKAVELGVAELIPVAMLRSVTQPVRQALERLRRVVVEASKQCGRNRLMQIAEPMEWPDFVEATRDRAHRLLAHPQGSEAAHWAAAAHNRSKDDVEVGRHAVSEGLPEVTNQVVVAVGPEGGFAPEETTAATAAHWRLVDLGPRILRTETAAILMVALAAHARSRR